METSPPHKKHKKRKLFIMIPAYNEEQSITEVVNRAKNIKVENVEIITLVINDGSKDNTERLARDAGADFVVTHKLNRGLGAAIRTGVNKSLERGADMAVMLDADGEYAPEEIPSLIKLILRDEADYVLGSRFMGSIHKMKPIRRLGNLFLTAMLVLFTGKRISDGQTGLRAFSKRALQNLEIIHDYNYAQVLTIDLLRKGYRMKEIPISYSFRKTGKSFVRFKSYALKVFPAMIKARLRSLR
ncbi:MAG: glycosyltransferase family 2 protein [Promethearchaeota archaeon]